MDSGIRYILITQACLGVLVAIGFVIGTEKYVAGLAALYGAAITMLNSWMMHWRLKRATQTAQGNSIQSQFHLYIGFIERIVFAVVLIMVGIKFLNLMPVPLVAAFVVTQLGFLIKGYTDR
jgi:F0F1-type ATP synthase assembly protein I